jgi:Zn-dependent peptidase ImmA (M78 family)
MDGAKVVDAENEAAQLLDRSWWASPNRDAPLPVDPVRLAAGLGIHVRKASLPSDESGRIEFIAGDPVVTINAADHPNRQRFTCAHEIGHYLRRAETGDLRWIDYRATLAGLGVDNEEIFANQFAAALLMPKDLVRRWHSEGRTPQRMARDLGTSVHALELRLRNLRLT